VRRVKPCIVPQEAFHYFPRLVFGQGVELDEFLGIL
jgi:hypothetical protein